METKNNKTIVTLLIVIILLLVCAVGFLGYKLYFNGNENNPGNTNNPDPGNTNNPEQGNNENENNNDNNDAEDNTIKKMTFNEVLDVFERRRDPGVVELEPNLTNEELATDFKNIDKSINDYNITVSCDYYDEEEKNCETYSVKVNSTIEYYFDSTNPFDFDLFNYNEYLVLVQPRKNNGLIEIKIFDKNNKEVYRNSKAYSIVFERKGDAEFYVSPAVINNKLYFVEGTDASNNMSLVSINLLESIEAKTIGEFVAQHNKLTDK